MVKHNIRQGVKFMPTTSSEYQWFQLKKDFFGFDENVYACCVYYSPRNSSYNANSDTDLLDLIWADMSQYSKDGNIFNMWRFKCQNGMLGTGLHYQ